MGCMIQSANGEEGLVKFLKVILLAQSRQDLGGPADITPAVPKALMYAWQDGAND